MHTSKMSIFFNVNFWNDFDKFYNLGFSDIDKESLQKVFRKNNS